MRKERGRRRRKQPCRERNHERLARRNSKYLGLTTGEAARPALRKVDWGDPPVIVKPNIIAIVRVSFLCKLVRDKLRLFVLQLLA